MLVDLLGCGETEIRDETERLANQDLRLHWVPIPSLVVVVGIVVFDNACQLSVVGLSFVFRVSFSVVSFLVSSSVVRFVFRVRVSLFVFRCPCLILVLRVPHSVFRLSHFVFRFSSLLNGTHHLEPRRLQARKREKQKDKVEQQNATYDSGITYLKY